MIKSLQKFLHLTSRSIAILFFVFITFLLVFIYRETFTGSKIALSTNYLAHFFSPWSTYKFPGWEQGIPHKPIGTDLLRIFYPGRIFANQQLHSGKIPLWNPYVFSGHPYLANFQSTLFYPLNILFFMLPNPAVWTIFIILHPLLATLFTYGFLRCFSLRRAAAILGAFSFGFSGFILTWMQEALTIVQAAIWLPAILYVIEKYLATSQKKYLLLLSLLTCVSIFAGQLQITFYVWLVCFLYVVCRFWSLSKKDKLIRGLWLIGAVLLGLSLAAVQIIPSAEAIFLAPRLSVNIDDVFNKYLLSPINLLKALAPDIEGNPTTYNYFGRGSYNETIIYIGVIPLVFALYSLMKTAGPLKKWAYLFGGLALGSMVMAMNTGVTWWILHLPIPLVTAGQPDRILFIAAFCLSILSAFGLSAWLEENKVRGRPLLNGLVIALMAILVIVILIDTASIYAYRQYLISVGLGGNFHLSARPEYTAIKNVILPLFFLVALLGINFLKRFRKFTIFIVIALTVLGQIYFLTKYLAIGDKQFLYPDHPIIAFIKNYSQENRFLAFGEPIPENTATIKRIYSPEGYEPIFPYRYGQLLYSTNGGINGRLVKDIPRGEARLSWLGIGETLPDNPRRLKLMALLGIKYIFYFDNPEATPSAQMVLPKNIFKEIFTFDKWHGYEYLNSLPRAFLADKYIYETDPQKTVDLIFNPEIDLKKTIITDEKIPIIPSDSSDGGKAEISSYQDETVVVRTSSLTPKILFLSDNYFPGWKASIDKLETKIYRADFTFRAVVVPAGNHQVIFSYEPESFRWGILISTVSSFFWVGGLIYLLWSERKKS